MTVGSKAIISAETKEKVPPLWQRVSREVSDNKFAYLLLVPSVLVFVALVLYPLANTIIGAFSETDAVGRVTHFGTLANFRELIDDSYTPAIIRQTVIFVFGSVILTVLLSFPRAAGHLGHDLALDLPRPTGGLEPSLEHAGHYQPAN
jgi:ABC-type polysaccharide transport system permease subunit